MPGASFARDARVFLIVCALVLPFVLQLAMTQSFSHDENQHIAAGALVAREGLLPYRDFPHFHTPYLAFVYALLFQGADHLLLVARLFTVACATAMVGLLGSVAFALFRERGSILAWSVCAGAVLLFISAGVFGETTGRAWNHEPGLLFALLAFIAHTAGIGRRWDRWFIASGVLLGISIGLRITFAPLAAPFGIALMLHISQGGKLRALLHFAAGLFVGMLGLVCIFIAAPEQAFFGNFGFPGINIIYRTAAGNADVMTLASKLRYIWKAIVVREFALVVASLLPMLVARLACGRRVNFQTGFVILCLPFVLLGCLAPSPLSPQYFYPLVPFLLLAALHGLVAIPAGTVWFRRVLVAGAICALVSVAVGRFAFIHLTDLWRLDAWTPIRLHRRAVELRAHLRSGRVLTLAPYFPLEAGLSIYRPFANGPFAWRVAPLIEPGKAARLGIITPAALEACLDADPPDAIVLGVERGHEAEFRRYADKHGYVAITAFERGEILLLVAKDAR